ncbi:hypothetical protein acdb102_14700 [Acidothermaceae bacterium B102]|nr:hypothetical protein acdb102_14700 [Acidothermaceae bacterium B102]
MITSATVSMVPLWSVVVVVTTVLDRSTVVVVSAFTGLSPAWALTESRAAGFPLARVRGGYGFGT